jgi:hypothetical protein
MKALLLTILFVAFATKALPEVIIDNRAKVTPDFVKNADMILMRKTCLAVYGTEGQQSRFKSCRHSDDLTLGSAGKGEKA